MGKRKPTKKERITKAAARHLMELGAMSYSDIADHAGMSRQAVRQYALYHGLDPNAHQKHLSKAWSAAVRVGKRLVEREIIKERAADTER